MVVDVAIERPIIPQRVALRPKEAAAALGLSERAFRQILPELPHFHVGKAVLLPVEGLQAWVREKAIAEENRAGVIVNEILGKITD